MSYAAEEGALGIVKLLLDYEDVDPNSPDGDCRTPLSFAAEQGAQSVVKLLLKRVEIEPDSPDNDGRTPLSFAAEGGGAGYSEATPEPLGCRSRSFG